MNIFESVLNAEILIGMVVTLYGISLPFVMLGKRSKGKFNGKFTVWIYLLTASIFGLALLIYGILA